MNLLFIIPSISVLFLFTKSSINYILNQIINLKAFSLYIIIIENVFISILLNSFTLD